ncbi:hypothetical protein EVAR_75152_1 [Eumeta japonica]|uniref:Uncharacterized protein n=1 Tax=Eumeta variegata TaxID=151549 RepID=A0A4C1U0Q1_EUMVA|nr:hypothetical protein EVAR_75152_1 [Eumeta japonica]
MYEDGGENLSYLHRYDPTCSTTSIDCWGHPVKDPEEISGSECLRKQIQAEKETKNHEAKELAREKRSETGKRLEDFLRIQFVFIASAAESECGSQSSLALDLHASGGGGCGGVTLRVRDNTRRRPLARQSRLHDDLPHPCSGESNIDIAETEKRRDGVESSENISTNILSVDCEQRASSAPPTHLEQEVEEIVSPVALVASAPAPAPSQPDTHVHIEEEPPDE